MKKDPKPSQRAFCALLVLLLSACAGKPPEKPLSESAQIQFRKSVGQELSRKLEPQLSLRQETDITDYLEQIAQKIADSTKDFPLPNVKIALLNQETKHEETWKDYALPGGHIYLAVGTLRLMRYQNEVAAQIALQLAHLRNEDILEYFKNKQIKKEEAEKKAVVADAASGLPSTPHRLLTPGELDPIPEKIDYFSPTGAFAFDETQNIEAVRTAVDLLYSAGYDPRGLVSLWQTYLSHSSDAPYDEAFLKKILDEIRRKIAQKAPLRNPIVSTEGFIAIRKRIEKL
jgi:predicted Zn-dependent protease